MGYAAGLRPSIPRHVLLVTFSMLITRCAGQHRSLLQVDSKVSGAPVELAYKSLYRPETCGKSTAMFLAPPLKLAAGIPEYLPKRTFGRLFDAYRIQNVAEMQGCVCCHSGWDIQRVAEMQGCVCYLATEHPTTRCLPPLIFSAALPLPSSPPHPIPVWSADCQEVDEGCM